MEYTGDMIISILETYLIEVVDNGQGHTEGGKRDKNAEGCREQLRQLTHLYVPKINTLRAYPAPG